MQKNEGLVCGLVLLRLCACDVMCANRPLGEEPLEGVKGGLYELERTHGFDSSV